MRLKHHIVPFAQPATSRKAQAVQQAEPTIAAFPEDSWLNDAVNRQEALSHPLSYEDFPTVPFPMRGASTPYIEPTPALPQSPDRIEVQEPDPLDDLLADESVTEIMALGPCQIYARKADVIHEVSTYYVDQQHMLRAIKSRLTRSGLPIQPLVDGYLPDGSLISVTLPPNAVHGPMILIKKRVMCPMMIDELVQSEMLSPHMADFLDACMQARLNILICGARGSGRTTLMRALCGLIPEQERTVTIEEMAELRLKRRFLVELVAGGVEEQGRVTLNDLVMHALHMQAERIIVGECRGDELITLLQAMDAGQQGILTALHSQNVRDCMARLDALQMPGLLRSPDLLIHLARTRDGSRKVANIAEVQGLSERGGLKAQSIFYYYCESPGGKKCYFTPSGLYPKNLHKFMRLHINVPRHIFVPVQR